MSKLTIMGNGGLLYFTCACCGDKAASTPQPTQKWEWRCSCDIVPVSYDGNTWTFGGNGLKISGRPDDDIVPEE